jgi:glycosyltransferase involved in cell wall biosynthesis
LEIWQIEHTFIRMKARKVSIYTISTLTTDQRIQRAAGTLSRNGYQVTVFARKGRRSTSEKGFEFDVKRLGCIFSGGPLFYLEFNVKIFINLLFTSTSLIYANDLDTLPGCWLASILKSTPLVYDSHELFTEIPELIGHPAKKRLWAIAEQVCIRRAKCVITVSEGIARELNLRYGVKPLVVRNLPGKQRDRAAIKEENPTLIYQGVLNVGRGLELAIDMMAYLSCCRLLVVGSGDVEASLRLRVVERGLSDRVEFLGVVDPQELPQVTGRAWLGLSLEEDMGLSYRYALPNKVFSYIACGVPVLVSDLPEMRSIVESYHVGIVATTRDTEKLAGIVTDFIENQKFRDDLVRNTIVASEVLCWDNESSALLDAVGKALGR